MSEELLLLLLLRRVAVGGLLRLLLLIAVRLLCRIAGVLRLRLDLTLWVAGGERVDLASELMTKGTRLSGRLIARRRRGVRRLWLRLVGRLLLLLLLRPLRLLLLEGLLVPRWI